MSDLSLVGPAARMIGCDLHVHTSLSHDGVGTVDECCRAAIARGIGIIGFAEHVDFDPADPDYGYYSYDACASAVASARKRFAPDLEILLGAEIDYQEWLEDEIGAFCDQHRFDFIIGSVHAIGGRLLMGRDYCASRSAHRAYADYFEAVGKSATSGLFDVIGHFGYATRRGIGIVGPPDYGALEAVIVDALTEIIRAGACLEINFAGLRHAGGAPYPDERILSLYRALGGQVVSLGSDAHRPEEVGLDVATVAAYTMRLEGLQVVSFRRRERLCVPCGELRPTVRT